MKLDFLKKGFVNTANFIPNFAYGHVNKNPASIGINVIGRLLSMYLYFQFNASLDIKSIIIAILFPTLYIVYIIAINGIDNVLDLFGLKTGSFSDIFSDNDEKCVEKRGEDGDKPSNPTDKKQCENVIMGKANSRTQCEAEVNREEAKICKYIGGSDTKYRSCSSIANETSCNSSDLSCRWDTYIGDDLNKTKLRCDEAEINNGTRFGVSIDDCPSVCPYYRNEGGRVQLDIEQIFKLRGSTTTAASTGNFVFHTTPTTTFTSSERIVIEVDAASANDDGFTPFTSNAYNSQSVSINYIDTNNVYTILKGDIEMITTADSTLSAGGSFSKGTANSQLNMTSGKYIITLENPVSLPTPDEVSFTDGGTFGDKFKAVIDFPTSSNTCGKLYDSNGKLQDFAADTTPWTGSNMHKYEILKNTGECRSTS